MSAAVENGVEASKPRGVFSRAFAKRAQPFEEALTTLNRLNKEGEALALQDDLTTHPTLALMRRILADAQAKFRVMVEENAATGARLDGELERARGECAVLRGELRDVRGALPVVLNNNNGAASNLAAGNSNNNPTGNATASPGQESSNELQQQQSQDDGKRLSAGSSPVDKRSSASDKSASPIEKRSSPVDRKDRSSPIDRRGSPIEKRNGSPSRSPSEKARRAYAPVLEKTRLAGSGGSVDSRSGSASPDRGCGNRSFFHRGGSDRSSVERLRISTNRDSLRSSKEMNDHEKDSDKDLVDGEVRAEEDNEPPGPAPGSRPSSPANSLGIGDPLVASRLSNIHGGGGSTGSVELASTRRLRLENERLVAEVARLRRLLFTGAGRGEVGSEDAALEEEARFVALEMELQHAKEALQALKADRKRLKAEKFDLLNQMKALYGTLEDKERELRDFIRNYEQRMRENEATLGRLQQQGSGIPSEERERERERERWSLLRAARDEADRSLSLAASLADKEAALSHAHATIKELQRQLAERGGGGGICLSDQESLVSFPRGSVNGAATPGAGSSSGGGGCGIIPHMNSQPPLGSTELGVTVGNVGNAAGVGSSGGQAGDRGSCSADSGVRGSSDRESGGATSVGGNLSDSTTDAATTPKDCSPTLSPLNAFSRSMDNSSLSRSVEQLSSPLESEPRRNKQSTPVAAPAAHSRSSATRGGTWGSISRVFARSRHRKAANNSSGGSGSNEGSDGFDPYRSWSPLTEEGYAEKLRLLREAASVPMERWRAPTVLAWLEVALGMPQYGPRCAENIKSGKVLLELNDQELEAGLGVTHPLHRKKLRLAIEEHRHPSLVRYPCIAQLGHTWVSSEWLPDLGLAQYSESFATNMVDARMLDHLSKKELEKLLGVTRKFHQASIVHGIHLLRMLNYDRQALAIRRHQCEQVDTDPLVWTNQRFIRWARNIDLTEYAENLKDSGVHGALVVLEPSFTGDTMATALGIPPAKHMIRRHLTAELEALVVPARGQLEVVPRNSTAGGRPMSTVSAGGSLGRGSRALHLQHHQSSLSALHMTANHSGTVDRRRSSLRTCSLLYLKKLSWKSSQGSLSRAFGLRPRSEKASPSSSSDTGSLASQYMSSARSNSPPPPQLPPRPITSNKRHRRVKSIGDIDYITSPAVSTPV
ncbi:kazrin isoform X10 [Osmia bicornis bicornis]|uniref:kazrin isoform X10 n=1 Tax=Osmia bicornis bicornis TaxID=1437191 RepID=UPI0010F80CD9|nr:kazrin isoform X10 [Osmia bicornis bicornis]